MTTILGIETSCDETAAAIVSGHAGHKPVATIRAQALYSQIEDHARFGGVVPEIAARAHVLRLDHLIGEAMQEAQTGWSEIDGIAATCGPGLSGGLIVGATAAKTLSLVHGKPFIAVNHLEGHALTPRLTDSLAFPYVLLLVSGGHSQIIFVEGLGRYRRHATTIDDALGEAFDKTAKLLGLGYPGGPHVEAAAGRGDPNRFKFPRPMRRDPRPDFSFSGLKTAVRQAAESLGPLTDTDINDLCAGFQAAIAESVTDRVARALTTFVSEHPDAPRQLVVAGGVAANAALRAALDQTASEQNFTFVAPPLSLCTDNAAMIAFAGLERLEAGLTDPLDAPIRTRWPLDTMAQGRIGSGKRGVKA